MDCCRGWAWRRPGERAGGGACSKFVESELMRCRTCEVKGLFWCYGGRRAQRHSDVVLQVASLGIVLDNQLCVCYVGSVLTLCTEAVMAEN